MSGWYSYIMTQMTNLVWPMAFVFVTLILLLRRSLSLGALMAFFVIGSATIYVGTNYDLVRAACRNGVMPRDATELQTALSNLTERLVNAYQTASNDDSVAIAPLPRTPMSHDEIVQRLETYSGASAENVGMTLLPGSQETTSTDSNR